ncbi:MAG: diguanylate cyclase [Campylobacterales bacterium]|nr:diguanylate cyclase [Campylobacterales bacterium]
MHKTYRHTALHEADFTLNAILDVIAEGIWDWDALSGHVTRSSSWYTMLGYEVDALDNNVFTWENLIHPDDYPMVMQHFESYIAGKIDKYSIEYRCKKNDGSYLWIVDSAKIVERHEDGSLKRMIGAHQNIHLRKIAQSDLLKQNQCLEEGNLSLERLLKQSNQTLEAKNQELEKKIQEIERLSTTDTLTQLPNRRKFESEIEKEIARSNRYGHPLSCILFDIDFFKHINDKYGHKKGDMVLKKLAFWLKHELRSNDTLSRWGGEEFVLLLPDTPLEDAIKIAKKLKTYINQIDFDNDLYITCSFGVASYQKDESVDELFVKTDQALYQAKELGRNRVEVSQNH